MAENTNALIQAENQENQQVPDIIPGFGSKQSLELAIRAANVLSKSTLVPKEYQGNVANCLIALNMANRMNADPLMVMQNLFIVYGRPGWSSQFLISTFNTSGKFSALRYKWGGEPGTDGWWCQAWAIEKASGEKLEGAFVTIGLAKEEGWYGKNGSKWKTMPQQMLMYRAASWFIRAYAPELAMGMHTTEELHDVIEMDPESYRISKEINQNANKEMLDIEAEQGNEDTASQANSAIEQQKEKGKPVEDKPAQQKTQQSKQQTVFEGPGF
jgi:hypothetical protein